MTQRSILAGKNPDVIVKAGINVTVRGTDGEQVTAETTGRWGLKLEKHSPAEFARARAAVGEHVLFDLHFKRPQKNPEDEPEEVIEVQLGASGEVLVPFESNVKVYAGKDLRIEGVRGRVDAFSGWKMELQDIHLLGHATAGGKMDIHSQTMAEGEAEFKAGSDLRFHVHDLTSAHLRVKDLGGYWEARIGGGEKPVYLKSGGDVTLVTDQKVEPLPPEYVLGKIEKPPIPE
jgi:hypothetical protein